MQYDPILQMESVRLSRLSHLPKVMQLAVAQPGLEPGLSALDHHVADAPASPGLEAPAPSMIPGTRGTRNEAVSP